MTDTVAPSLRRAIKAPKGHQIVVADSAQIELRVNAWLAGHSAKLDVIRAYDNKTGPDPYCVLAGKIYGRPVTKADKLERFVGKEGELGLGFGMGGKKFKTTLLRKGVDLEASICMGVVKTYRKSDEPIVNQWKYFDHMLASMLQEEEGEYGPDGVLRWTGKGCPTIWMPNGLGIYYPGLTPTLDKDDRIRGFSYAVHNARKHTWGGTITENVVQSLARHVIAQQMLEVKRKGHRIVMMTHDEIVCIAPNKQAERCLETMIEVMRTPPLWAQGLPLNAEGGFDSCYSK